MKIIFAGTPEFALEPLNALLKADCEVAAVLTQPDKPQGRKGILTPSPVKKLAMERDIPVLQPEKLKLDYSALAAVKADLMVTCAYGQILTQEVLELFPRGVWNIHASLLPAYRGAAPIPRVIMNGERETGVTIMKTDVGLDTGAMLLKRAIAIESVDTQETLSHKLSKLGAELIVEALPLIESGASLEAQGEGFVCKKVQRTEVDFTKPAREVSALIRGLSPAPASYASIGGMILNFFFAEEVPLPENAAHGMVVSDSPKTGLIVACGEGAVRLSSLQAAGGKRMSDSAFLNGRKVQKGMRFEPIS